MAPRLRPLQDTQVSPEVRRYFRTAEERGAPNAMLLRLLARDPNSLHVFYDAWSDIFYGGHVEHLLKELVRVRMARLRSCSY